jgi:hypothetical protein
MRIEEKEMDIYLAATPLLHGACAGPEIAPGGFPPEGPTRFVIRMPIACLDLIYLV